MKPIELTLYDPETNEAVKTYTRSFVPWEILKSALRLNKRFDSSEFTEEDVDELAALAVAVFGYQFSVEQVNKGTDIGEMMTVIQSIVTRASQFMGKNGGNPTLAAKAK